MYIEWPLNGRYDARMLAIATPMSAQVVGRDAVLTEGISNLRLPCAAALHVWRLHAYDENGATRHAGLFALAASRNAGRSPPPFRTRLVPEA